MDLSPDQTGNTTFFFGASFGFFFRAHCSINEPMKATISFLTFIRSGASWMY
jgi:hypothetical protein